MNIAESRHAIVRLLRLRERLELESQNLAAVSLNRTILQVCGFIVRLSRSASA
ncbi:MAG TPA: hypothetical protein VKX28_31175 [Xanthobacteraceae bacterium]|nr:hypothetical protein [Xanthobacteraceae bacterium]